MLYTIIRNIELGLLGLISNGYEYDELSWLIRNPRKLNTRILILILNNNIIDLTDPQKSC